MFCFLLFFFGHLKRWVILEGRGALATLAARLRYRPIVEDRMEDDEQHIEVRPSFGVGSEDARERWLLHRFMTTFNRQR